MKQFGVDPKKENTKDIIMPQELLQKKIALRIMKEVAREMVHYDVMITPEDFKCYMVTIFFLRASVRELARIYRETSDDTISLPIGDLFSISIDRKDAEDAENTGNINVMMYPGPKTEEIVENLDKYRFVPDYSDVAPIPSPDPEMAEAIKRMQVNACKSLVDYNIFFKPEDNIVWLTAMTYLQRAIVEGLIISERVPDEDIEVLIHEEIEIHICQDEKGKFVSFMPGAEFKLAVKSDFATEFE